MFAAYPPSAYSVYSVVALPRMSFLAFIFLTSFFCPLFSCRGCFRCSALSLADPGLHMFPRLFFPIIRVFRVNLSLLYRATRLRMAFCVCSLFSA